MPNSDSVEIAHSDNICLLTTDSGWNVTKAISFCLPAVAVAVPSTAATTQHCVVSSTTSALSVKQHCAITQASTSNACQQNGVRDAMVIQPVTQKLTEQGIVTMG